MTLGEKLTQARKAAGLTQADLRLCFGGHFAIIAAASAYGRQKPLLVLQPCVQRGTL